MISVTKSEKSTTELLVEAALAEFSEAGFEGTDSNRIARRAGFAPQTFYRWFPNKLAIFLAAYQLWQRQEWDALTQAASPLEMAGILVEHHRRHRIFRCSLRQLAVTDEAVRAARTASRQRQLQTVAASSGAGGGGYAARVILLLEIERLADAVADGELADLGVDEHHGTRAIASLIGTLLQG